MFFDPAMIPAGSNHPWNINKINQFQLLAAITMFFDPAMIPAGSNHP